jgi:putative glutamine transport system substrate-binding protein
LRLNLPDAELIGYKTYPEAYAALKAGNGEAMMADDTLLLGLALNDPSVKILQKRYSREPYAIALRKDSDRLLSAVDGIIKELQNSGELTKLQNKWGVKK